MSAYDPKRTSGHPLLAIAEVVFGSALRHTQVRFR
jgi:hypothetical protein